MELPLDGVLVVDFSQFLAGPYASLRLLDMGARVIKVENPDGGDLCRSHYLSETEVDGDSTLFHAINRGKQSIALNLKTAEGLESARKLMAQADIVIQNFRPGVMDRLGVGYATAAAIKPDIIYGSISGYGAADVWADAPGQDLLAQARSGIMWLSGNSDDGPVPLGLPIADIAAGAALAQGLLGALFRHARTGRGAHVETSLLEALIDLQFEFLTTYRNNGLVPPERLQRGSAHGYLAAPYGVYPTSEGFLAIAMTPLPALAEALGKTDLFADLREPHAAFQSRDEIYRRIERHLRTRPARDWEADLSAKQVWCAEVVGWDELTAMGAFDRLGIHSVIGHASSSKLETMRSPIRLDGQRPSATVGAPLLNAHATEIRKEFDLH